MNRTIPCGWGILAAVLNLAGCAAPGAGEDRRPLAFHDTRLQYAILAGDREILRKDFRMNPDRTPVERGIAAFALPVTAATEALFWPVFHGLSSDLAE
jgi:hypothetical protein